MTKSTSEESKKTNAVISSQLVKEAEQATSNQQVVNLFKDFLPNNNGNSHINNTRWQRRNQTGLNDMINELISESATSEVPEDLFGETIHAPDIIEVSVSHNKLEIDSINSHLEAS